MIRRRLLFKPDVGIVLTTNVGETISVSPAAGSKYIYVYANGEPITSNQDLTITRSGIVTNTTSVNSNGRFQYTYTSNEDTENKKYGTITISYKGVSIVRNVVQDEDYKTGTSTSKQYYDASIVYTSGNTSSMQAYANPTRWTQTIYCKTMEPDSISGYLKYYIIHYDDYASGRSVETSRTDNTAYNLSTASTSDYTIQVSYIPGVGGGRCTCTPPAYIEFKDQSDNIHKVPVYYTGDRVIQDNYDGGASFGVSLANTNVSNPNFVIGVQWPLSGSNIPTETATIWFRTV